MPYNPGLGQGHGKKRHLHAHSPVNLKELKCYDLFIKREETQMFELNKWLEELDAKGTPVSLDTQAEFPYSSP
jgi:hypothetical protein